MARLKRWCTVFLVCFLTSLKSGFTSDFRYVQGTDLTDSLERFSQQGVARFSELVFDIPHYQLIAGARDYLFRLSLEGLRKLEEAHWPAPSNTVQTCRQKGQTEADCRNFVKVLLLHNSKVFTCGTNAFAPECSWREVNAINTITESFKGATMCPYSPHYNSTSLITVNGDYYIASPLAFTESNHAIYRTTERGANLSTVQYDHKWLSGPDFIGSFEIDNFAYFFFRESAVEYLNCGKVVYSRVGRVCKNDKGGQYILKDNWTTFLKARLNCSLPGDYPFYYNEIQSVYYLEQEQMVYATFNTPKNSIYGAAICAFNMSSIARSFEGAFKYQDGPKANWERKVSSEASKHFQCETPNDPEKELEAKKYQLMDEPVQPAYQQPVYTTELERLSHIVVDVVQTKYEDGVHVIFIATIEGTLRKMVVLPKTWKTCLVEEIEILNKNSSVTIHTMKLSKDISSVYLGTDNEIIKISVQRCNRFKSKAACLNAMDPYCGWNENQLACTTAPHRNPRFSGWKQDLLECPRVNVKTDGNWSPWTKWRDCSQAGIDKVGEKCLCHTRTCTNPSPSNGGKPCLGVDLEVTNCTRNGQWTEWSAFSACSASCGMAVKTRRRVCGNPSPAFGGRVCIGPERDEIYCTSNPPCPSNNLAPINGQWSEWTTWDDCSVECGGGMQTRKRKCNSPAPANGGLECFGCNYEYRQCNTHKCPEIRRTSPWTPWLRANTTKDGHFEQRFRFTCKVNVPDQSMAKIGPPKKEERFCLEGQQNCLDAAFVSIDGEWSEWNAWSKCTVACGGGTQFRERACDNPRPTGNGADCQGELKQEQECNLHTCQGYWSCWTEMSSCSVTCGGGGTRFRVRKCLVDDYALALGGCVGPEKQEVACDMPPCRSIDGWEEWSVWSLCDSQKEQHRKRKCVLGEPTSSQCQGPLKETRLCIREQISAAESVAATDDGIHVAHVISAFFCGIILAFLLMIPAVYFYLKKKGRQNINRLAELRPSKQNHYVNDDWKNNFNAANDPTKIPLRDSATIKRNGFFRAQLDSDNNF